MGNPLFVYCRRNKQSRACVSKSGSAQDKRAARHARGPRRPAPRRPAPRRAARRSAPSSGQTDSDEPARCRYRTSGRVSLLYLPLLIFLF